MARVGSKRKKTERTGKTSLPRIKPMIASITREVLSAFYEFGKDFAEMVIDPYGKFYETMTSKPRGSRQSPRYTKAQVSGAIHRLKQHGFIGTVSLEGKTLYKLTESGYLAIKQNDLRQKLMRKKPDGKYYLVIFDIPESERHLRDYFRQLLKELNFTMLQASVWLSPVNAFDELEVLIPDIKKHKWIKFLKVSEIV